MAFFQHAKSSDPAVSPVIDPHYFENKIGEIFPDPVPDVFHEIPEDLEILLQEVKFIRSMRDIEPWKSGILREVYPGPDCISDDDLRGENFSSQINEVS